MARSLAESGTEACPRWVRAHEELVMLATKRAGLDFEEGVWLRRAFREAVHARLGYGSFVEYVERLFGFSPRLTFEKLRVANALEGLPTTARAFQAGKLSFSAVRELTRVVTAETEKEWVDAAGGKTVREVEALVSGQRQGNRPGDLPDVRVKRHVLRFDVSGEVLAIFREAMAKIRREAGEGWGTSAGASSADASGAGVSGPRGGIDDDAVILQLSRQILGGPKDEGRSSYQVALTICECCGRGLQQARGESVEVSPEVVEMACCDAQHVGRLAGLDADSHPRATGHASGEASSGAGVRVNQLASCQTRSNANVGAHWRVSFETSSDAHVGVKGRASHEATSEAPVDLRAPRTRAGLRRASQAVPPAVRRAVLRRDGGRCRVPGCRHATFVDVHHVVLRAEGGSNAAENLVTLCAAHHRACHRGELVIEGTIAIGLRFAHADGTPYGGVSMTTVADGRAKAWRTLVSMGFAEREAKGALARVQADPGLDFEMVLRRALRELGS